MMRGTLGLDDAVYDYLLRMSLREPDVLRKLREETVSMPMARMQVSPELGQFLALLTTKLHTEGQIVVQLVC